MDTTTDKQKPKSVKPKSVTKEEFVEQFFGQVTTFEDIFDTVVTPLQKELSELLDVNNEWKGAFERAEANVVKAEKELSEARGRIERLEAGWVSVKEGLPEKGEGVQCFFKYEQRLNIDSPSGKSITVGMINEHGSWVTQASYMIAIKAIVVTHWRPLPEPPKGV